MKNLYTVTIGILCETPEQAHAVLDARLGHDEEIAVEDGGPFEYTIEIFNDLTEQ